MPSNRISINSGIEYNLSDSKMEMLLAYLDAFGEKTKDLRPKDTSVKQFSFAEDDLERIETTATTMDNEANDPSWKRGCQLLGDAAYHMRLMLYGR